MRTLKLMINGMHCVSCALNIDGELEDTPGIKESKTNFAKSQTEVTFDEQVISLKKIMQIITDLGYQAAPFDHF